MTNRRAERMIADETLRYRGCVARLLEVSIDAVAYSGELQDEIEARLRAAPPRFSRHAQVYRLYFGLSGEKPHTCQKIAAQERVSMTLVSFMLDMAERHILCSGPSYFEGRLYWRRYLADDEVASRARARWEAIQIQRRPADEPVDVPSAGEALLAEAVGQRYIKAFRRAGIRTIEDAIEAIQTRGIQTRGLKTVEITFGQRQKVRGVGSAGWTALLAALDRHGFAWREHLVSGQRRRGARRRPRDMGNVEL
jgi:hypothetical protein